MGPCIAHHGQFGPAATIERLVAFARYVIRTGVTGLEPLSVDGPLRALINQVKLVCPLKKGREQFVKSSFLRAVVRRTTGRNNEDFLQTQRLAQVGQFVNQLNHATKAGLEELPQDEQDEQMVLRVIFARKNAGVCGKGRLGRLQRFARKAVGDLVIERKCISPCPQRHVPLKT